MGAIKGFIKGFLIGGGIALLYAPKTGKELRAELMQKADDAKARANAYGNDLAEKGNIVMDTVKDTARDIKEDVKATTDKTKANLDDLAKKTEDNVKDAADDTKQELDKNRTNPPSY